MLRTGLAIAILTLEAISTKIQASSLPPSTTRLSAHQKPTNVHCCAGAARSRYEQVGNAKDPNLVARMFSGVVAWAVLVPLLALVMLVSLGCQEKSTIASTSETAPVVGSQPIKVFFPKLQKQPLDSVEPVQRQTQVVLMRYAIAQLIAGPTPAEKQQGFVKAINLKGNSNCGADFKLSLTAGIAKLQFCRQVISGGVGDDARAISSITQTLKQFPGVQSVVILVRGNCLGDMSGENRCLR